jgi:hypothetical protein
VKTAVVTIRKEPFYRREAIERGLKRLGYNVVSSGLRPSGPESLLCLWNKKKGKEEQDADAWERQGGTVIVMENGYLQKVDKSMYAVSVHGHNGSGWFPVGDEDRFTRLGFPLKEWTQVRGGHVLVCAQRGIGSAMMASPPQWAEKTAAKLRTITKLPVRVRAHPGNFVAKVPLEHDLRGADSVCIWSSGAGVRALVEGIPVAAAAPHWVCEDAAPKQWAHAGEDRYKMNREKALHRMSHAQWSVDEIAAGEPFVRILAKLGEACW